MHCSRQAEATSTSEWIMSAEMSWSCLALKFGIKSTYISKEELRALILI